MTAIAVQSEHASDLRVTLASISSSIRNSDDPATIKDSRDKVRMAREWARIHGVVREVHEDLIRIEVECLRRLAQLGDEGLSALSPAHRKPALFFASLTDEQLADVIKDFGSASTASGVYRAHVKSSESRYLKDLGRRIAKGAEPWDSTLTDEQKMDSAVERFRYDTAGAVAQILDDIVGTGDAFFIEDVADAVIGRLRDDGIEKVGSAAVREGIREVCRKAVRAGSPVTIFGTDAPRFVTCSSKYGDADFTFMRVPFENATLPQLDEMVALRAKQLDEDRAALARLTAVRDHVASVIHPGDSESVTIGLALARASMRDAADRPVWNPPDRERVDGRAFASVVKRGAHSP